jgi:hypothetical protein
MQSKEKESMVAIGPADGLHVEWVEGEAVVLKPRGGRLHYMNGPAAAMYALILEYGFEKGTEEFIRLRGEDAPADDDVNEFIDSLVDAELLVYE